MTNSNANNNSKIDHTNEWFEEIQPQYTPAQEIHQAFYVNRVLDRTNEFLSNVLSIPDKNYQVNAENP